MEKLFIHELNDKQVVESTFLAKNKILLTDKKGNKYISLYLSDKTGSIDAKIWDNIERLNIDYHSMIAHTRKTMVRMLDSVDSEQSSAFRTAVRNQNR